MEENLEYAKMDDNFFDFFMSKYTPKSSYVGKLRSSNLLINSFMAMKCDGNYRKLVNLIRKHIGVNNTVWGVKNINNSISWELYFYNYKKDKPLINITDILKIIKPFLGSNINVDENIPYFMFSIDITPEIMNNKNIEGIDFYIEGSGRVFSGASFYLNERGVEFKNNYDFYDPKKEMEQIITKIKRSAFVDFSNIDIREILYPEIINCKSICVCNKRKNDGIYFVGLDVSQLLFCLKKLCYPESIISFIESNKLNLDHMQYEISIDYITIQKKLVIIKSGYYGTF